MLASSARVRVRPGWPPRGVTGWRCPWWKWWGRKRSGRLELAVLPNAAFGLNSLCNWRRGQVVFVIQNISVRHSAMFNGQLGEIMFRISSMYLPSAPASLFIGLDLEEAASSPDDCLIYAQELCNIQRLTDYVSWSYAFAAAFICLKASKDIATLRPLSSAPQPPHQFMSSEVSKILSKRRKDRDWKCFTTYSQLHTHGKKHVAFLLSFLALLSWHWYYWNDCIFIWTSSYFLFLEEGIEGRKFCNVCQMMDSIFLCQM